ncbi:M15 family metallopeptidase [uncultured Polaribacter sp.]|uniref:M15 family metallopeptidase n=1 Tax=uncultured Polaribacter sp. TaxID=174711 RepID=UPI00261F062A|nr:M15 family metallopeptidase [uncultured Polaribacter sp.]
MQKSILVVFICFSCFIYSQEIPSGFTYLNDVAPSIQVELCYLSDDNFIGKPIDGYKSNCLLITKAAAKQLQIIQQKLKKENLGLKIFDAYRPQQAINHFVKWARVLNDTLMKKKYYPNIPKSKLFKLGYIASKSGHTRGSTVDLTIIDLATNKALDMGSIYDFFGKESHPFYKNLTKKQQQNRLFLRKIMMDNGFKPYDNEWWHFTLRQEPYPKTYFNFPVH